MYKQRSGCLPSAAMEILPTSIPTFRPLVFLLTMPITPRRIRRFLFCRIIPPVSSYKQNVYHSSMANYETRADAQCAPRTYNWPTLSVYV